MFQTVRFIQMMSLTFGLFTQVSGLGPLGPLVSLLCLPTQYGYTLRRGSSTFFFVVPPYSIWVYSKTRQFYFFLCCASLLNRSQLLKERICFLGQILFLKIGPHSTREANRISFRLMENIKLGGQ